MRVLFPAAAFAATVLAADAAASPSTGIFPGEPEAFYDESDLSDLASANTLRGAMAEICRQLDIINDSQPGLQEERGADGAVIAKPGIAHFGYSRITFPPLGEKTGEAPEIVIQWPDLYEDGFLAYTGERQHILLEKHATQNGPFYSKGFEGAGVSEDMSQKLQCFASASSIDGILTTDVSCTDLYGHSSTISLAGKNLTLTYSFNLSVVPPTMLYASCQWNAGASAGAAPVQSGP